MHTRGTEPEQTALVARAVEGDVNAAEELLAQIRPMVMRYCRARLGQNGGGAYTTADDVTQEVCIAVLKALPKYKDMGHPFAAFVFGIASHKVADAHRASTRNRATPTDEVPEPADYSPTPEAHALSVDTARSIRGLLDTLPDSHRDVILMRVVIGLSAEETGTALGMSAGAVRVAQHRGLSKLRKSSAQLSSSSPASPEVAA